ncbi:MAG TPA: hypothetical protein VMU14_14180 [Acidimicrobiales bacterium]|nr:hypothetical protein [Acidimicrobiales bacterium]
MTDQALKRWLERHNAQLLESKVTTVLGRGPTLGRGRGATWISFQSRHALGRVARSPAGHCHLSVRATADGSHRMDSHEEVASAVQLDAAMALLVAHLT